MTDWVGELARTIRDDPRCSPRMMVPDNQIAAHIRAAVSREREKNEAGLQKALVGVEPADPVAMMRACFDLYTKILEREEMLRQLYRKWLFCATHGVVPPTPDHGIDGLNEIIMGGDSNASV